MHLPHAFVFYMAEDVILRPKVLALLLHRKMLLFCKLSNLLGLFYGATNRSLSNYSQDCRTTIMHRARL